MPSWAPIALSVQLLFVFLAPPFSVGTRSVFPSDLWCWAWLAAGLADLVRQRGIDKRLARFFVVTAVMILWVYAQGYFRPSIVPEFKQSYFFAMAENELFQPGRELVVALRFLSWLWAMALVYRWGYREHLARVMARTLAFCVLASVALMALERFSPSSRQVLAGLYGFDTDFKWWEGRMHGSFRSPVEAGCALAFSALFLVFRSSLAWQTRAAVGVAALFGLGFAKTLTPLIAAIVAAFIWLNERLRPAWRRAIPLAGALIAIAVFIALVKTNPAMKSKLGDFLFRFGPWSLYLRFLSEKWHWLLFGFGFAPYHADNFYLFLVIRGGIFLFAVVAYFGAQALRRSWEPWSLSEKIWIIFLLITAFVFDVLIYRHVVSIVMAVGMTTLARQRQGH